MIYHVALSGSDHSPGTVDAPFRTIQHAAQIAAAGDIVQVHSGTYREWVDPKNSGFSDRQRITYEAAPGEHVVIKGSEIITDWEHVEGTIWKKVLPNSFFGDFNPYAEKIEGDWFRHPQKYSVHSGDVYVNGKSMYEATSLEDLYTALPRTEGFHHYPIVPEIIPHPEDTVYRWFALVEDHTTTLLCNFQDKNPNKETIEINVRQCCFYPRRTGIHYITVRGFEMAHTACSWAPPTAEQIGMIGPNWSKGWIIENNHLHDAKCCAVSIGKESSTGQNFAYIYGIKSGHRCQIESVFAALQAGWSKENIGSHIIRNNVIHDCGQCGIVGNLGCVFSRIEHNHIYNISVKREFWGHEMAAIKLHAAIDVCISGNLFHDCHLGIWLDWQAQGARVSHNLSHRNDRADLMIEVTHGPCTVDNNIFLSDFAVVNHAQGTAFVHNLMRGGLLPSKMLARATPYHLPHSTTVRGYVNTYGGDDRILNNIFLGETAPLNEQCANFSNHYDEYTTPEEYAERLSREGRFRPVRLYVDTPQPVWIDENVYAGFAKPFRAEKAPLTASGVTAEIEECNGVWILTLAAGEKLTEKHCEAVTTERLGAPRITEEPYENPDGTPINFREDYFGNIRKDRILPGPFAVLSPGTNRQIVWKA